jgi:hypothetical protein
MVTEEEWAWLAGVIDGEGCITLIHRKEKGHSQFEPFIGISQKLRTGLPLLEKAAKITGRRIIKTGRRELEYRSVQIYGYENVLRVLEKVLPYLTNKRERAELMIKYCKSRLENFGYALTPEEVEIIKAFRATKASHIPLNKKERPEIRIPARVRKEIIGHGPQSYQARVVIPRKILMEAGIQYHQKVYVEPLPSGIRISVEPKKSTNAKMLTISTQGQLFLSRQLLQNSLLAVGDPIRFVVQKGQILILKKQET